MDGTCYPRDPDTLWEMIEEVEKVQDGLSQWEVEFLDSVRRRVEAGYDLSKSQEEKLVEVYERVVGYAE